MSCSERENVLHIYKPNVQYIHFTIKQEKIYAVYWNP